MVREGRLLDLAAGRVDRGVHRARRRGLRGFADRGGTRERRRAPSTGQALPGEHDGGCVRGDGGPTALGVNV